MKIMNLYLALFLILLMSCSESGPTTISGVPDVLISEFEDLMCMPDSMPLFDVDEVSILDDNNNIVKDSIVRQIEKRRHVFKPCREMIYRAIWKDKNGQEITNSRIKMMASGQRWDGQAQKQDEILIQMEFTQLDKDRTQQYQLNKGISDRRWMEQGIEGVVENVEIIWMHPFRFNQYNFTEVAPFPEVQWPLKVGKTWNGQLRIMEGWGDWSNTSGQFTYEVVGFETVHTAYGVIRDCWKIKSYSMYEFGNSVLVYWFNEDLGFVRKEYKNYGGQSLFIEIESVIDKSI